MRAVNELKRRAVVFGLLGMVVMPGARSENATVLESFETSIDSATKGTWAGSSSRLPDGVALGQYTAVDGADPYVTEGSRSLKVDLSLDDGWSQDFTLTLSAEASDRMRTAMSSTDVARYIIRYDVFVVSPPAGGIRSINHEVYVGELVDMLSSITQGRYTMSIALDLLRGVSMEGPVVLRLANNFASTEQPFVGPLTLYVDNLRLVDTYVTGAVPVTYTLQSFEDDALPTGGVEHITSADSVPRTSSSRYGPTSGSDARISEGAHSLRVDFTGEGRWDRDLRLPLQNTRLADVLKLDRPLSERPTLEQLGRYTLRFDVLFPDLMVDWSGTWMYSTIATPAQSYPVTKGRTAGLMGRRETVSMTLDQVLWGEASQGAPALIFAHSGAWGRDGTTLFYDNFRLIDTGTVELPSDPPVISSVRYDLATREIQLTWSGVPGRIYDVVYSLEAGSATSVFLRDIACPQGQATVAGAVPAGETAFFQVLQKN